MNTPASPGILGFEHAVQGPARWLGAGPRGLESALPLAALILQSCYAPALWMRPQK